jgi:A/G-specific adenine glycosylase
MQRRPVSKGRRVKLAGRRGVREPATPTAAVADPARLACDLLGWYARAKRDLPWRGSRDPYRVWVSEIMLQQTQVERVKDYFVRFIARFPTVESLAMAEEHEVLRLWEGLGYYRRARQLHAAAMRVVADHGGRFPRTAAGLRGLPGIGRYTAGAIASIALGRREPIVEANSRRVIARLAGHAGRLDGPGGDEPIWRIAAELVPARGPGRFNQALMDLGAMVCTPEKPLCGTCPVARHCRALADGRVAEIPAAKQRRAIEQIRETAVVVRRGSRVLVVRRGPGEWWEGLWDFPRLPGPARAAVRRLAAAQSAASSARGQPTATRREKHGLAADLLAGLACGDVARLGTLAHSVTHHRITLDVVGCNAAAAGRPAANRRWVTPAALATLAMTAPGRRIARLAARAATADD